MKFLHCMSRTKLIKYVKTKYPDIDAKHGRPSDDLISDVAKREYSERSLGTVGVLETTPYVICPVFHLKNLSDQKSFDKFKQFINELSFEPIGNESFSERNINNPEDESDPKRYQSNETLMLPKLKKDNPFLFQLVKTIAKTGKSFNPLLCIDEMRILKSDPMLPIQKLHGDNSLVVDAKSEYSKFLKVLTVIVALDDNTTLDIMIDKHLTNVPIPKGSMIIFDSAIGHCGSANTSSIENIRVHCKLKSRDIILAKNTVVEYEPCMYECGQYFSCRAKRKEHHRNCSKGPNYEHRRKIVTKSDDKYRIKLKLAKNMCDNNANNNIRKRTVDEVSNDTESSSKQMNAINTLMASIDSHNLTPSGDTEN